MITTIKSNNMITINLTESDAAALLAALNKFIDKDNDKMLGVRKFTPTYAEVMAAIVAANQIHEAKLKISIYDNIDRNH